MDFHWSSMDITMVDKLQLTVPMKWCGCNVLYYSTTHLDIEIVSLLFKTGADATIVDS